MALRWTATCRAGPDARGDLRAQHGGQLRGLPRGAVRCYGAPAQNFVYADVDGHIGYQFPGYVPIRSNPDDRGDRPVRGDDGSGEWTGRIPFDDLPWQFDPQDGRDRHRQQRRGRRELPALRRPRNGTRATAPSGSSTRSTTTPTTA